MKIIDWFAIGVLVSIFILFTWGASWAASEYLDPDGSVSATLSTQGAGTRAGAINDYPDDGDAVTYLYTTTVDKTDYYSLSDPTVNEGTIDKIIVHAWVQEATSGTGYYFIGIRAEGDGEAKGSSQLLPSNGSDERTLEVINNPDTGEPWQWDELDGLEFILRLVSTNASYRAMCHSATVEIIYTLDEENPGEDPEPEPEGGVIYTKPYYVNDWTGEYTTDFETYKEGSMVTLWGSGGPQVFITKKDFMMSTAVFGALLSGVLLFVLFKAVL